MPPQRRAFGRAGRIRLFQQRDAQQI
jgi:hypothetical protein